jgi:hypothetical protein
MSGRACIRARVQKHSGVGSSSLISSPLVDACERGASYATPAVSTAKEEVGRRLSRMSDLFFSFEASDLVEDILFQLKRV